MRHVDTVFSYETLGISAMNTLHTSCAKAAGYMQNQSKNKHQVK
jgi:hypothetical protein